MGVTEIILCSSRLVLEGKICKEIPESSGLEFFEKFSVKNDALSEAEDNTFRPNTGGIADLPYWHFGIGPKSQVSGMWWILLFH